MNLLIFVLSLFVSSEIQWQANRQLTWDDFKGPVKDTSVSAQICTELRMEYVVKKGKNYFIPKAMFHPFVSFVSPKCTRAKATLKHEQLHFDITEIYARQLRRMIEPFQGCINVTELLTVKEFYQRTVDSWNSMQVAYEQSTESSQNIENQLQWNILVADQLNSLQSYELKPK